MLRVLSLNVANGSIDEASEHHRFGVRLRNICALLQQERQTLDVLCLSELAPCRAAPPTLRRMACCTRHALSTP